MARSTTVPAAGNIARKSFAGEEKAKEECYAEQLKKYGRLMVYSNKKKNGFYLIEPAEGGETVSSRYTADGGKIREEAFDPKAMPASTADATWRSRGLTLEESEQIKEKRSLSSRRKKWLDSVIEQAYEGQDKAEIANGVDDSMQFTDDLSNPVIYQDYRGTTLYMDFTGKAMENGEEQQLNQEEGSYLSQGLKNKWISFEGSLSKAEWQAVYEGVEEKYDNTPGFRPVNSVQKAAVLIYGKELTQGDLEKLGDLADSIKDDYDQNPNRFYKTDLNAKSIKGAYSYTELVAAGEVAIVAFKHKDLEQMVKKLENGEAEKAKSLMLGKFRQGALAKAKTLTEEKVGQSPLDEMESFQKMEAAKEFKELAEKMENEMTEQKKTYQLPEKYKEDIDEKYWQQSGEQLDQLVKSDDPILRSVAACYGRDKDLDKLVNDKDAEVRSYVAEQGRDEDLDKLVNDPDENVRRYVAGQGRDQDLDKLVSDEDPFVRMDVAKQGRDKDLDKLVSDDFSLVKAVVVSQGRDKDLDKLVNDPDEGVRVGVAFRGRDTDLDKLVHDSNLHVTQVARTQIRNRDLENLRHLQEEGKIKEGADLGKIADQLPGWRESNKRGDKLQLAKYGRDSDLDKLGRGESYLVRKTVALRGRDKDLDKLVDDPNWEVRSAVASQGRDKDLDKLVSDPDYNVRSSVASQGRDKDLDILVSDKNRLVRSEVARQGRDEDLDKLVNDENAAVRMEVAKQKRDKDLDKLVSDKSFAIRKEIAKIGRDQDLDKLVSDKEEVVRATVARQGRDEDLDKLVNDKASFVRSFVALQGRDEDLDKLVNDKSPDVRESVAEMGRDKDLKKLARDKDSEVRMAVAEYSEYRVDLSKDQDPAVRDFVSQRRAADLENRRRQAARQGLER